MSGGIIKIIIGETELLFRELLSARLLKAGFKIAGDTGEGPRLLNQVLRERPQLVLMNPLLRGTAGTVLTRQILQELPKTRMLAMCRSGGPFLMDRILNSGFHGCIQTAGCTLESLLVAVQVVLEGSTYFCPASQKRLRMLESDGAQSLDQLSQREKQVLGLIGSGAGNEEIASRLDLSPATAQTHRRNLLRKLQLHDTPSLMQYSIRYGFWQADFEELGLRSEEL